MSIANRSVNLSQAASVICVDPGTLAHSCIASVPVQEKRSAYAPTEEEPVRYDGIYRIARCWRKAGMQKFLVCRYLFVRCDNEPAPWSTEGLLLTLRSLPSHAQESLNHYQPCLQTLAQTMSEAPTGCQNA